MLSSGDGSGTVFLAAGAGATLCANRGRPFEGRADKEELLEQRFALVADSSTPIATT